MKRSALRLFFCLSLCFGGYFTTSSGQQTRPADLGYVPDEIIVRFTPRASRLQRDAVSIGRRGRILRRLNAVNLDRVQLPPGVSVQAGIADWRTDPAVVAAEPNYIRTIVAAPNDPEWAGGRLWGLEKIQAQTAWLLSTGGPDVVVANIDTGVNYNHPDLAANMWRNPGEVAGNGVDDDRNGYVDDVHGIDTANNDSDPMDDHGHGTHTAGTIGGVGNNGIGISGVNWTTRMVACKFLKADGTGTDADAIECFNYVVALKKRGVNIRVTSNSWGSARNLTGQFPQSFKNAIDAAGAAGILNVFAAGNSGTNNDTAPFDPASFTSDSIVSVAASDAGDQRPWFSNFGVSSVDLAAPGDSILSTATTGYRYSSGTSMAAPHVAGAVALVSSFNPALSAPQVKSLLLSSVDNLPQWNGQVASGGRLNIGSLLVDGRGGPIAPSVSLTQPASDVAYTAPATITVAAAASDSDGTISKVDFYARSQLVGSDTTPPYEITWTNVLAGSHVLTAVATDNDGLTSTSPVVTVTVVAPPSTISTSSRLNVALPSNGGTVTASTTSDVWHAAANVTNGDRNGGQWATNTWLATANLLPQWIRIDFAGAKTINEIDVFSIQDGTPVAPTTSLTFTQRGVTAFQLEYWTGSTWTPISGGKITGNQLVWRSVIFTPVTTTAVRVLINGASNGWAGLAEVEVYQGDATPPPPPPPPSGSRINVALPANGGAATASTTSDVWHAPSNATNGDRSGGQWATNTWLATAGLPQSVRVDFAGAKTINEIDVFSIQDGTPVAPTTSLTFTQRGVTAFQLEYWTGAAWAAIPGGTVTGNQLVWRQITFASITTTAIRIVITGTSNGSAGLAELEVYQGDTATPPPPPSPGSGVNIALPSNGGTVTASTTSDLWHAASNVTNGDRKGGQWATNTWLASANVLPQWVRVDFAGAKAINEIDLFSIQDGTPVTPTTSLTFTQRGITAFQVEYWTGSVWAPIPGGTVSGNQLVWRQVTFASITTTAIRVMITGASNGWAGLAELEVYQSGQTTTPPAIGTTYEVGPGRAFATPSSVPWESLVAGDLVLIHWRSEPYRDKWVICRSGSETAPITVRGVPGPAGQLPIIDGNGAITRRSLSFWAESRAVIKIGGANAPVDTMPKYVVIENLDVRSARPPYTFTDDVGAIQTYSQTAAAIWIEKGENITIRNNYIHDSGNGLFVTSWLADVSRNILIEGNHIYDNGNVGSLYEHNTYTEALGITYQYNRLGPMKVGALGNNLKDRSAGLVVRYNWVEGGNRQLDLVDTDNATVQAAPSYRETSVYGNVLIETEGSGNRQITHYGGDSGVTSMYRKGRMFFYNNTVISRRTDRTSLFRLTTNEEFADARNNIFYVNSADGSTLSLLDEFGLLDLTNNWFKPGYINSFGSFSGTVTYHGTLLVGTSPGFQNESSLDFRLAAGSNGRNAGAVLAGEFLANHKLDKEYVPHQGNRRRLSDSMLDIGAFEFDNTY